MTIPNDFPWRPGMRGICERASVGFRVVGVAGGAILIVWEDRVAIGRLLGSVATIDPATVEPDLTDPATIGALLGAVREAYGDTLFLHCTWSGRWALISKHKDPHIADRFNTEAEALLAAWAGRQVRS